MSCTRAFFQPGFVPFVQELLLAKLLTMIGWARDERVRVTVGSEARCALAAGSPRFWYIRGLDAAMEQGLVLPQTFQKVEVFTGPGPSLNVRTRHLSNTTVNILFADGHVQVIQNTISQAAWFKLNSRNDGLTLQPGEF